MLLLHVVNIPEPNSYLHIDKDITITTGVDVMGPRTLRDWDNRHRTDLFFTFWTAQMWNKANY